MTIYSGLLQLLVCYRLLEFLYIMMLFITAIRRISPGGLKPVWTPRSVNLFGRLAPARFPVKSGQNLRAIDPA